MLCIVGHCSQGEICLEKHKHNGDMISMLYLTGRRISLVIHYTSRVHAVRSTTTPAPIDREGYTRRISRPPRALIQWPSSNVLGTRGRHALSTTSPGILTSVVVMAFVSNVAPSATPLRRCSNTASIVSIGREAIDNMMLTVHQSITAI